MKSKKCRLFGWFLAAVMLGWMMMPISADAAVQKKAEAKFVVVKSTSYKADGSVSSSTEYEYDKNGNETKITYKNADGSVSRYITYEYDKNGNRTKDTAYKADDSVSYCYTYEYDENGNRTKRTRYNADGSVSGYSTYAHEYDGNGNLTKITPYDKNGSAEGYVAYEYDENGNMIKETECIYMAAGTAMMTTNEYDANGIMIKCTISAISKVNSSNQHVDSSVSYEYEYKYDEDGNAIVRIEYNEDGKVNGYIEYEYKKIEYTPEGDNFASYEGCDFYIGEDGNVRCYDSETGEPVINDFKCDGEYTYYFQLDGTAMKDRLTYHPDGEHVIYFDESGHEVFNDFAYVGNNIPRVEEDGSITLIPLNENCYFDGNGYQYTNVVTWGKNGTDREGKLFYANPGGVLVCGGWFTFSDDVKYAGDATMTWGAAGRRGYANEDCTLMRETDTYDENNNPCHIDAYGGVQ